MVLATLLVPAVVAGGPTADDHEVFKADPAIQSAMSAFARAQDAGEAARWLAQLEELAQPSYPEFVRQAVAYSAGVTDVRGAMACGVVIQRLGVSDRVIVEALQPFLEEPTSELAEAARNVLSGIEKQAAGRPPDYSLYREIVADRVRAGEELPLGLIGHMYREHPGEALLALMRAHQLREPEAIKRIIWIEHVVADCLWKQANGFLRPDEVEPDVARELERSALDPRWWVRLFGAEIMRRHAGLRRQDLIARLGDDEHVLVRAAALATQANPDN